MAEEENEKKTDNPDAEELARLRQEKADRDRAERDAEKAELEELRGYKKTEEERKAKAVKTPERKAEKVETKTETVTKTEDKPSLPRGGVSRKWFGNHAD